MAGLFRNAGSLVKVVSLLGYLTLIWLVVTATEYSLNYAFVTGDDGVIYRTLIIGAVILGVPPLIAYYWSKRR
ncbi:hypothetical protein [Haloferax larsenii]|uniref:Uncharacterized protein n=1 Tax=Haloferax larsenii TaxID=302484 RepID=A0A1H7N7Q3_HALLR|nr:hypothetical protein [Haloferax larsenii]SEL19321.1 hypothetical protein SAMN04488691_103211 [Haloferax larsenii]